MGSEMCIRDSNSIRDKYLKTVEYFVRAPKKTMNTLIGIIIGILIMFWLCPTGFLPEEDRGALFAMIQLQDGATLSRTADVVKTISDELVKIPGVVSVMQINGMNGENSAFCILKLEPWSKRKSAKLSLNSIMRQANVIVSKYPEVTGFVSSPPAITGMGMYGGFEYQLLDKGDRSSDQLFDEAQSLLRTARGDAAFSSLYTSFTSSLPQVVVKIEEDKAMAQGVSISEIYSTLAAQFGAVYVLSLIHI
mgnify:FL=1